MTVKTPAASAAIRGADWSLVVQGDCTALTILEGVVEFPMQKSRLEEDSDSLEEIGLTIAEDGPPRPPPNGHIV